MNHDIIDYIPQRAPFVMVDEIVQANEAASVTRFTIRQGHLFVNDGMFTEAGLVENMAQTAAAGTGYRTHAEGLPPQIGYIGAIKNLVVYKLPLIGDTITTEITFAHQVLNVHVVNGSVMLDGEQIASCELKIFLQQ